MTTPDFFLPPCLIEQALEDFRDEAQRALDTHLAIPVRQRTADERKAITDLRRDIGAYTRALDDYWRQGIYPLCIDGVWQIDSLSERGTKHHIWREEGKWACDCKCAERGYFHVHQALMTGIERAFDLAEQYGIEAPAETLDDYEAEAEIDDEPFLPDAAIVLGQRLVAARRVYLEAA